MITVTQLTKRYGRHVAVDDVSFSVTRGEVVGFLGPNGAGKSTTLRMLAGFLEPTSGSVEICGHDVTTARLEARRSLGYMPEAVPLYPEMRVAEYLAFRAELKGVGRGQRKGAVADAMAKASVGDVQAVLIGKLSKGYRQRVGLADALVAKPPLLILDEPTAGLDPNQIRDVRTLLGALAREHTVLLSTHILAEVEAVCSRVLLLHEGKLVAQGPLADLRAARVGNALDLTLRGDVERARALLLAVPGVETVAIEGGPAEDGVFTATVHLPTNAQRQALDAVAENAIAALALAGVLVRRAAPRAGSLEEVFAALTRDASEVPS